MPDCKVLQFNAGRGREAVEAMKKWVEEMDVWVVLVQEPYQGVSEWKGFERFEKEKGSKAQVWMKEGLNVRLVESMSNRNAAAVRVEMRRKGVLFVSVYDEPGMEESDRMEKFWQKIRRRREVVIGGDFNAKNEVWGGRVTDERGASVLLGAIEGGLDVVNRAEDIATFSSTMGESWIDLTLERGVRVEG